MNKYEIASKKCIYIRFRALYSSTTRYSSSNAKPNQYKEKKFVYNNYS